MTSQQSSTVPEGVVASGIGVPVDRLRHMIALGAPELADVREFDEAGMKRLAEVFGEWIHEAVKTGLAMKSSERREMAVVLRKWPNPRILSVMLPSGEAVNVVVMSSDDWKLKQVIPVKSVLGQRHWVPGCGRPKQVGKLPKDFDQVAFLGGS